MVHQDSYDVYSFSVCLEFSPKFLQMFVNPSDIIPLAVSEIHPPRKVMS